MSQPPDLPEGVCCSDPHVWLASNAWAVAGITRVLATVLRWHPSSNSKVDGIAHAHFSETSEAVLHDMLISILHCAMGQERDLRSGLLKNYLDGNLRDGVKARL